MPLKDDLQKFTEATDDPKILANYSHDASIFEIQPSIVVYPKTSEEIKALVKFASINNLSITPRSGGTDMSGAAIGEGIILDMKYFNELKSLNENSTVVQSGMFYRDFEEVTLKQNLLLPTYPASRDICTIGGMIVNNAGGELELAYGPINRYLKSLKVILADGNEYEFKALNKSELDKKLSQKNFEGQIYNEIYHLILENEKLIREAKPKVSKNSTGYELWEVFQESFDLSKLIIGSQGTLGIVTEAEFKLIKPKEHQALLVICLSDISELDQVVQSVLGFKPEAFECFDDQTLKQAYQHAWDLSSNFKHSNRILSFFDLKSDQNLSKLTLLANFTSNGKKEALTKANQAKDALKSFNLKADVKETPKSAEKYWVIRHKSFGLLMKYAQGMRAAPFIDDIIVKPQYLPEFLPKLNSLITPYKNHMIYTLAGHIGDGNFHIIPLMDLSKEEVRKIIPELMEKVFKLVFNFHGSMSGEHNDGLIRGPYLKQMYGEDVYQLFKKVKEIFDPKNIFNPHKKTDATFEYSLKHITKLT